MLAMLFISHGTPMLLAGDEFGRTQQGNNNAYCQDNPISWVDWSALLTKSPTPEKSLFDFTSRLIQLRKIHPSLRSEKFLHGTVEIIAGIDDVTWFDETGQVLSEPAWSDPGAQMLVLRRAVLNAGHVDITLALLNASGQKHDFTLPTPELTWEILLDSANPDHSIPRHAAKHVRVAAHSILLLAAAGRP